MFMTVVCVRVDRRAGLCCRDICWLWILVRRVFPPDCYGRVLSSRIRFHPRRHSSICREVGRHRRWYHQIWRPRHHSGSGIGISRQNQFLFVFHIESLYADTAGTTAAARSARKILTALRLDESSITFRLVGKPSTNADKQGN
jgi:hypothetical protein